MSLRLCLVALVLAVVAWVLTMGHIWYQGFYGHTAVQWVNYIIYATGVGAITLALINLMVFPLFNKDNK